MRTDGFDGLVELADNGEEAEHFDDVFVDVGDPAFDDGDFGLLMIGMGQLVHERT